MSFRFLILTPPCRVFVGFSSDVTYCLSALIVPVRAEIFDKQFPVHLATSKTNMKGEEIPQSRKDFGFCLPNIRYFHSCSNLSISAFQVAFGLFPWPFARGALAFRSKTCQNLKIYRFFAMKVL